MRFRVNGLAGRTVVRARLRLYQLDSSPLGGRVFSISSNSWPESVTWDTRPSIDGQQLASFGAVAPNGWYEVDLGSFNPADGLVSLAMDSTSSDGARWASRDSSTPPRLLLDVTDAPVDGLSTVLDAMLGSSDPTYLPTNHRLELTAGGRLLTVVGRHKSGVELRWRDPGGSWQSRTTGSSADGVLLSGTGTGDWPASIALARNSTGVQRAWVVWGRNSYSSLQPVRFAVLSDLDAPDGPRIGPVQTVDAPPLGAIKPDIAFERIPGGGERGALIWSRRTGDSAYEIVTSWFSDLDSDGPVVTDPTVILTSTSSSRYGTLVAAAGGAQAVVRGASGRMTSYIHYAGAPLTSWLAGAGGATIDGGYPTATALSSGSVLAAAETNTATHVVTVQRFSSAGSPSPPELQLSGYSQPTIASDGARAWIVMVRQADGLVVSREYSPDAGWSAQDRVEIGPEGGGNHAWPNAIRVTDGRLRFVVRGPLGPSLQQCAVLAFQRLL